MDRYNFAVKNTIEIPPPPSKLGRWKTRGRFYPFTQVNIPYMDSFLDILLVYVPVFYHKNQLNVGKYTIPMDPLGINIPGRW